MSYLGNAPVFPTESVLPGNLQVTGNATINGTTNSVGNLTENSNDVITTESTTTPKVPLLVAYKDAAQQSIPHATFTKVTFDAEEIDTDGWFSSSRYTPQTAGYYFVSSCIYFQFLQLDVGLVSLYKNGSLYARMQRECVHNELADTEVQGSCLIHCNGSTDYFEIYVYQDDGSSKNIYNGASSSGRPYTRIEAFLLRAD